MGGRAFNLTCWCVVIALQMIRLWSQSVDFRIFKFWCSLTFSGSHMGGMTWNLACWCILTICRSAWILVTIYGFSSFWCHLTWGKRTKFGVFPMHISDAVLWVLCSLHNFMWLSVRYEKFPDLSQKFGFPWPRYRIPFTYPCCFIWCEKGYLLLCWNMTHPIARLISNMHWHPF